MNAQGQRYCSGCFWQRDGIHNNGGEEKLNETVGQDHSLPKNQFGYPGLYCVHCIGHARRFCWVWPGLPCGRNFSVPLDSLGLLLIASTTGYMSSTFLSGALIPRIGDWKIARDKLCPDGSSAFGQYAGAFLVDDRGPGGVCRPGGGVRLMRG